MWQLFKKPKTHFLITYFSCKNDFPILILSIKSLAKLQSNVIKIVYVYLDPYTPLSDEEMEELKQPFPFKLKIGYTKEFMSRGGINFIRNELHAFNEIKKKMHSHDFIVKTDSDTLFLSHNTFDEITNHSESLIGYPIIRKKKEYIQGGCYFLKKDSIPTLNDLDVLDEVNKDLNTDNTSCPEDAAMWYMIKKNNGTLGRLHTIAQWENVENHPFEQTVSTYGLIHFSTKFKYKIPEIFNNL